MKNRFITKSLIAKIALVLVIIILFEFVVSEPVHAASLGGQLLNPVVNLVVYLADGVISILQSTLLGMESSFIYIDLTDTGSFWKSFAIIAAAVIGVIGLVAGGIACVATGGAALAVIGPIMIKAGIGLALVEVTAAVIYKVADGLKEVMFGNSFVYSSIKISPESILKNEISFFDVDFFNANSNNGTEDTKSITLTLRTIVSQVYNTVRDIALVAMLIVIIYVSIRMLLALSPKEKSRYKETAMNCIIGLILIAVMHFIMAGSVTLINMITNSINGLDYIVPADGISAGDQGAIDSVANSGTVIGEAFGIEGEKIWTELKDRDLDGVNTETENKTYIVASTFTEQARYRLQKIYEISDEESDETVETWEHIGWAFVYIMLVILTVAFVWMYGKRVVYMAALIMLAPIVGVMYPINRVNGSRAHTLNLWLKEFIGTLAIQPLHLFLYTILIGGAMELAVGSPVYVIVAIMGLLFIENLLKDLLGIQDTRMGNLGRSLQDTTRAIKTTERAATSIARTVRRTASRGVNFATGLAVAGGNKIGSMLGESNDADGNDASAGKIRTPVNQLPSQGNGGNNPPPSGAGAQNVPKPDDEIDNGTQPTSQNQNNQPRTNVAKAGNEQQLTPEQKRRNSLLRDKEQLEEAIKEEESHGRGNGKVAKEFKAQLDAVNKELASLDYSEETNNPKVQSLLDRKEKLENGIKQEEAKGLGDSIVTEVYRNDLDDVNKQLSAMGYNEQSGDAWMDADKKEMVKNYNGQRRANIPIGGDGEREFYTTNDPKITQMRINDSPNTGDPMAMQMASGEENYGSAGMGRIGEATNLDELTAPIENRGSSTNNTGIANESGTIAYGGQGGSVGRRDSNSNSRASTSSASARNNFRVVEGNNSNNESNNNVQNVRTMNSENNGSNIVSFNNANNQDTNNTQSGNIGNQGNASSNSSDSGMRVQQTQINNASSNSSGNGSSSSSRNSSSNGSRSSSSRGSSTESNNTNNEARTRMNEDLNREQNTTENNNSESANQQVDGSVERDSGTNNGQDNFAKNDSEYYTKDSVIQGSSNNTTKQKVKKIAASAIQKGADFVGTAGSRAVDAAGTAVEGVIDTALNAVSGNVEGTASSVTSAATGIVGAVSGTPRKSSSSSEQKKSSTKTSSKRVSQDVQTIMKESGLSEENARAIEEACKRYGINDDRNMAQIGKAWKNASEADKPKIFELAQEMIELKRDRKEPKDVERLLDGKVSSGTKTILMKMYGNLIG